MLTVTMAITLLVVIMACWARVPVVAGLRRVLIDGPAAWLNGLVDAFGRARGLGAPVSERGL